MFTVSRLGQYFAIDLANTSLQVSEPQLLLSECKSQLSIIVGHLSCNSPHWHLGQQISDEYTDGKPANGALNGLGQLKIQLRLSECSVIIITDIMELGILMVLVCKQKGHE
ncbi:GD14740 [Drosophila simulans]|uniref:GD14740 n=1 Tax=Drosophila simulans TaxID=7240 RepID=B4QPD9_DROSI|nr:GD14740 [Drosophila simulans]